MGPRTSGTPLILMSGLCLQNPLWANCFMTSVWADLLVSKSYVPASYDLVTKEGELPGQHWANFSASSIQLGEQGWGVGGSYPPELQGMVVPGGVPFAVSSSAGSLQQGT